MADGLEPTLNVLNRNVPILPGRQDTPPKDDLCHIVRTVARMMDVPIVMVVLSEGGKKTLISQIGLGSDELPPATDFSDYTLSMGKTVIVPDAVQDQRFGDCPLVTGAFGVRFYAGTPLKDSSHQVLGTLCIIDKRPRSTLSASQLETLEDMAQLVADRLELQRRNHDVVKSVQREAMRHQLLQLVLEAPNFDAACNTAMEYIRSITGALFCRLFRLAEDGERVAFVAGANANGIDSDWVTATLRKTASNIRNTVTGNAMVRGEQIVVEDITLDHINYPRHAWLVEQGARSYIATPLAMLNESHAFGLGFGKNSSSPQYLAMAAEIAGDMAEILRPMLRRLKDEATARLFRRAVECSPDPVLITEAEPADEPGPKILYCNQAFLDLTGFPIERVIGHSPRFLHGRGTEPQARKILRDAISAWQPVRQVITNHKADGTAFQMEMNLAPVADSTGYFTHWVCVQRDVTPQHRHEVEREAILRELQALFGAMPGAILRYRRKAADCWERTFVSASIEILTGSSTEAALRPEWAHEHMRSEDMAVLREGLQQACDRGNATAEFRFRHENGDLRLIQARMCSYLGANGEAEIVTIWADITRERRMSAQLDQASKLADLGELAAGLAHELNRPLASIMLASENATRAMQRGPEGLARVAEKLQTITNLAQHGSDVVRHVQLFGRIDGGEAVPVALTALLNDMMILAQAKFMECNVSVETNIPPDLPHIIARPIALEQVLINLISNACDAYESATPKIEPMQRKIWIDAALENSRVVINVRDRAGGVPEQHLPHLFDAFFTTKPIGKGTGLGLSISSGIVREMGGKLSVFNNEGGAIFVLDLPAVLG